ncbi:MAG: transglutaminase family protein [Myxococcales bacterium]|nr:transglutaminase family protein [Myxococcales bacterium]
MTSPLKKRLDDETTPIELLAFELARDVYPALDEAAFVAAFDEMAQSFAARAAKLVEPRAQALALSSHCYASLGFRGDEDNYYDPQNSFLSRVIERRRGIPISLAIVLMAIGRRVGFTVEGVGFPGHFLARVGGEGGVLVDPFNRGALVDDAALERLVRRSLGPKATVQPQHVATVDRQAIIVRMLTNLDAIYSARKEHALAMLVCDRLFELTAQPTRLRDRATHALALGAVAAARQDFERYLELVPDASDARAVRDALARASAKGATFH